MNEMLKNVVSWFKKMFYYTERSTRATKEVQAYDKKTLYLPLEAWANWPQWVNWDQDPRTDLRCTGDIYFCRPEEAEELNGGYDLTMVDLKAINPKDMIAYVPLEKLYHL